MKVVVTGATSMIGTALIKECIKNNDEVMAIVRKNTTRLDRLPKSELISYAYSDLDNLDSVSSNKPYDVFYHFAWGSTAKGERDNPIKQENNIKTTLSAINLANKLGCKKFVGAGSQAEYGPNNEMIDTNTECHPVTAYGMCKLSSSMLGKKLCEQLDIKFIWGRIFSVYGTNDNNGTMLDYAIHQFINGEVARFSSAKQTWNYLYEDDAGKIFYLLGSKDVESGVYNIANKDSKVLREYIKECANAFGDNCRLEFAEIDSSSVYGLNVDICKTIDAINYVPTTSFKEGIKKTIDALCNKTVL